MLHPLLPVTESSKIKLILILKWRENGKILCSFLWSVFGFFCLTKAKKKTFNNHLNIYSILSFSGYQIFMMKRDTAVTLNIQRDHWTKVTVFIGLPHHQPHSVGLNPINAAACPQQTLTAGSACIFLPPQRATALFCRTISLIAKNLLKITLPSAKFLHACFTLIQIMRMPLLKSACLTVFSPLAQRTSANLQTRSVVLQDEGAAGFNQLLQSEALTHPSSEALMLQNQQIQSVHCCSAQSSDPHTNRTTSEDKCLGPKYKINNVEKGTT